MFAFISNAISILILALLLLLALVILARSIRRNTSRVKDEAGCAKCVRCGYDLRGNKLPRCPECGALLGFKQSAEELGIAQDIRWKGADHKGRQER